VDLLVELRDTLLELGLLALASRAPDLEQLLLAGDSSGSFIRARRSAEKNTLSSPSRSASSRACRAASSSKLLVTMARLARV
jgi:hypothetical protein